MHPLVDSVKGWTINPPEDSSVDLGKGWKIRAVPKPAAIPGLEQLGGIPPGPAAAPLPFGLMTAEQQAAAEPPFRNPRTGIASPRLPPGREPLPFSVLEAPITGGKRMVAGAEHMAEPGLREKAGGLHEVIGGAFEAATPVMIATGLGAPLRTAAGVGTFMGVQTGTERLLKLLGVPLQYSALAGDLVGILGGGATYMKLRALAKLPYVRESNTIVRKLESAVGAAKDSSLSPPTRAAARAQADGLLEGLRTAETGRPPGIPAIPGAGGTPQKPPPPPPATPPAGPTDIGKGWTVNPIEEGIAGRERAATAERKATYPAPAQAELAVEKPSVSGEVQPTRATLLAPPVSQKPQVVTPSERTLDLGKGWKNVPAAPEREEAPAAGPAPAPTERGPGFEGRIPTSEINLDPVRFQYKREGIGQHGVGDQFKDVTVWDPDMAGTSHVWLDPENGKTYAVNAHHRVHLAQRLNRYADESGKPEPVPEMQVRYLDAKTAPEAYAKGALINIAEGSGTAIDAARFFRHTGMTPETLAADGRVLLRKQVAQQGAALANLSDAIFDDVVHGLLPVERAAIIGSGVSNHADQTALYALMRQREGGGKRLTDDQIEELIRMNNRTSTVTENRGGEAQGGLFGVEEMTRSLLPEKAIVSDYVRKQLGAERKLFGAVSTQTAADRLGEAGNVIKAGVNAQTAERANQGSLLYDRLSTKAGPIDDILDRAAQRLAKGGSGNDIKQQAYAGIRDYLKGQLAQLTGVHPLGGGGVEGLREERVGQAGPGEPNPLEAGRVGGNVPGAAGTLRAGPVVGVGARVDQLEKGRPGSWIDTAMHPAEAEALAATGFGIPGELEALRLNPNVLTQHLRTFITEAENFLQHYEPQLRPETSEHLRDLVSRGRAAEDRQTRLPSQQVALSAAARAPNPLQAAISRRRTTVAESKAKLSSTTSLVSPTEELKAKAQEAANQRQLTHDQLTAQLKSGGQVKPSNLKPKETRGMFEEERPETGDLFGSERGSLSPKPIEINPVEQGPVFKKPASRLGDIADFFRPVGTRIRREGPAGKELERKITRARDIGEVSAGKLVVELRDSGLLELSREDRQNLVDVLQGVADFKNPAVEKAAQAIRQITDKIAREAVRAEVQVKQKVTLRPGDPLPPGLTRLSKSQEERAAKGERVAVTYSRPFRGRQNFYPHVIRSADALRSGSLRKDVIENMVRNHVQPNEADAASMLDEYRQFMDEGGRPRSLEQHLVESGQARDADEAYMLLTRFRKRSIRRQGSLEYSRQVDLPFYDPDPARVLPNFVTATSMRLAQVREFGQGNEQINKLIRMIDVTGGNSGFVRSAVDRALNIVNEPDNATARISRFVRLVNGFKLGLSFIPNATQGALNSFLKSDLPSTIAGGRGLMTAEGRRFAMQSGASLEGVITEMLRSVGTEATPLTTFLKATGFTPTEQANRVWAANSGLAYAKRLLAKLQKDPKDTRARHVLEELGLKPDALLRIGKIEGDAALIAAKKFSDITQFRAGVQDFPMFASTSMGKVIFQFKSYVYGQTRLAYDELVDEMRQGRFGRGLRTFLVLATVMPLAGEVIADLRTWLKGGKRQVTGLKRYFDDIGQAGSLGIVNSMLESAGYGRAVEFLGGPTLGTLGTGANAAARDVARKGTTKTGRPTPGWRGRNFSRFLFTQIPLLGPLLVNRVFPRPAPKGAASKPPASKPANPVQQMKRQQRKLLHP
jgi:hypothetical protein